MRDKRLNDGWMETTAAPTKAFGRETRKDTERAKIQVPLLESHLQNTYCNVIYAN